MEETASEESVFTARKEKPEEEEENGDVDVDISGKLLELPLSECSLLHCKREERVEGLYVYNNAFSLVPRSVWQFSRLKTLKFFGNEINILPSEVEDFLELEKLQVKVSWPEFSGIPFRKLSALKELELSNVSARSTGLSMLTEISGLTCLRKLSICHLSIRYLPPEIGLLKKLEELDLSFNKLKTLPDDISELISLNSLKVSNNKLVNLPSGLSLLQRLENLDLSNNRLTSLLPLDLSSMHKLHYLNLQHNKLISFQVPSWVCCIFEGNEKDISKDDYNRSSCHMGVSDDDVHWMGVDHSHNSLANFSLNQSESQSICRYNASRRMKKKWTRRYYFQHISRNERSNQNRKFKNWFHDLCLFAPQDIEMLTDIKGVPSKNSPEKVPASEDNSKTSLDCEKDEKVDSVLSSQRKSSSCLTGVSDGESEVNSSSIRPSLNQNRKSEVLSFSSEESKNSVTSKRHCDVNLDNPKRKCHRPFEGCLCLSCKYSSESYCGIDDRMPDGFYDAGRDRKFMSLCNYDQKEKDIDSREVIVLDRETDEELDAITLSAKSMLSRAKVSDPTTKNVQTVDELCRASMLALFVSDFFGGSDRSYNILRMRNSALGSIEQKPFICTCLMPANNSTEETIVFSDICDKSLRMTKEARNSVIMPIGSVRFGVCRHRAILMKYLCDRVEPSIPCELVRGYLDFSPHAWNVVPIKNGSSVTRMLVDTCYPTDIREETDPEFFCRYIPLSRTYVPSPNGSSSVLSPIPSLPFSFQECSAATGFVKQCQFGDLTAAAKVHCLEVKNGISKEDIKIFEYTFLGEVRILGALRHHKSIVKIYGHHFSSTWVPSSEGNKEYQVFQSAIIMEYIKGGSLKNYMKKLSEKGEKQVPPELALSIARGIACALVEIHSKDIIHRDIKSENVLVDLEDDQSEKSQPIVKLCDFDRAVPLHSFLHTCCISHLGIHPPNVCVGTPCWMAPEVISTIRERAVYGLEVDIWSFGCLILELLTLRIPYEGLSESEVHQRLQRKQRPEIPSWMDELSSSEGLSSSSLGLLYSDIEIKILKVLVDLFYRCTQGNPSDRPTALQIYDELCHVSPSSSDGVHVSTE